MHSTESLSKVPFCLRLELEHCCMCLLSVECVQWTGGAGGACSGRSD